jgi:hypothetical protein
MNWTCALVGTFLASEQTPAPRIDQIEHRYHRQERDISGMSAQFEAPAFASRGLEHIGLRQLVEGLGEVVGGHSETLGDLRCTARPTPLMLSQVEDRADCIFSRAGEHRA